MVDIFLVDTTRLSKANLDKFEKYLNNAGFLVIIGNFGIDYLFKDINKGDLPAFNKHVASYLMQGKNEEDFKIAIHNANEEWVDFKRVYNEEKRELWSFYLSSGRPKKRIFAGTQITCEKHINEKELDYNSYMIIHPKNLYRDNNGYLQIH